MFHYLFFCLTRPTFWINLFKHTMCIPSMFFSYYWFCIVQFVFVHRWMCIVQWFCLVILKWKKNMCVCVCMSSFVTKKQQKSYYTKFWVGFFSSSILFFFCCVLVYSKCVNCVLSYYHYRYFIDFKIYKRNQLYRCFFLSCDIWHLKKKMDW